MPGFWGGGSPFKPQPRMLGEQPLADSPAPEHGGQGEEDLHEEGMQVEERQRGGVGNVCGEGLREEGVQDEGMQEGEGGVGVGDIGVGVGGEFDSGHVLEEGVIEGQEEHMLGEGVGGGHGNGGMRRGSQEGAEGGRVAVEMREREGGGVELIMQEHEGRGGEGAATHANGEGMESSSPLACYSLPGRPPAAVAPQIKAEAEAKGVGGEEQHQGQSSQGELPCHFPPPSEAPPHPQQQQQQQEAPHTGHKAATPTKTSRLSIAKIVTPHRQSPAAAIAPQQPVQRGDEPAAGHGHGQAAADHRAVPAISEELTHPRSQTGLKGTAQQEQQRMGWGEGQGQRLDFEASDRGPLGTISQVKEDLLLLITHVTECSLDYCVLIVFIWVPAFNKNEMRFLSQLKGLIPFTIIASLPPPILEGLPLACE